MPFEADLKSHLAGDGAILAIVGDRIHPIKLPQGSTKPAITYGRISGVPMTDLDCDDGDLLEIRLQIDCWASGFETVRTLAELVRVRLQTAASSFRSVLNFDRDVYEDDTRLFRTLLDVSCWYRL